MDKIENKLRSSQFPYHLSNVKSKQQLYTANKEASKYYETPTTYMVVNFDDRFVESIPSEKPSLLKVDEKKTKAIIEKLKRLSPERQSRAPRLATSYLLPKKIDPDAAAAERNMFRRADVGTQTDINMNKMVFEGMTGYQNWTSEVVEPFLKVILPHAVPMNIALLCFNVVILLHRCLIVASATSNSFTGSAKGSESEAATRYLRLYNTLLPSDAEGRGTTRDRR